MMKKCFIMNDPLDDIILAALLVYPKIKAEIYYDPSMSLEKNEFGATFFPDDGFTPIVYLNPYLQMAQLPEILAHELAHIEAGYDAQHGPRWEEAFSKIQERYLWVIKQQQSKRKDIWQKRIVQ